MRVRNHFVSGRSLGRATEEGESPVCENEMTLRWYLSTAGHEKPCWKPPGPSGKAKYSIVTDSELVP